jgi:hypothetical protein
VLGFFLRALALPCLLALTLSFAFAKEAPKLQVFFLGDKGHHQPKQRFDQIIDVLSKRGIVLTYTDQLDDLNAKTLSKYDGLVIFANHTKISPEQEKALLEFVASGKGFIPLHCASYCFLNSPAYIDLVGAQFRSHGTGVFRTELAKVEHPILKGFGGFESWDETYLHTKHNEKDRVVLEYRAEGTLKEPWTWVRTQGKGRVFYTAWGHDRRTWGHPGFQNLVERGIRWACKQDPAIVPDYIDLSLLRPKMTRIGKDAAKFEYVEAKVPFYPAGERWGTTSKPKTQMQKPLSPQESMQHMVTPDDFEIKLFADEKLLGGKPICMNWDERGRLWLALTLDYPNELQPKGKGRDRIVIIEDTNNDGLGDKITTFADKLSIPTSILPCRGGLLVHQAPETLFLQDADGDGVADRREVLFSGWATNDTHAGPSNLVYGPDNWIYGMVGYAGFNGVVGGEKHSFRQGFYRFRPDGSKLEFLRNTNNNSWGVGFSEDGHLFGSTANGTPSVHLPIPNRYYEAVRGWSSTVLESIAESNKIEPITDKVRQVDHHGGFTAAAGHALYTARTYPAYYWNRTAFVTEPTGHLAATFVLEKQGTSFRAKNSWNLIASDDEWCAPIMAEVGPDGNVWVLDWYNFIVQHNPTPVGFKTGKGAAYETELRDKKHGRIYRLVHKKGKESKSLDLAKADAKTLVATLTNDNLFWRKHAQRLLIERGKKDVVPELVALTKNTSVDAIGLTPSVMHAMWTLAGLDALNQESVVDAIRSCMSHPSAAVRRVAIEVAPKDAVGPLGRALTDDDLNVRLAAYLKMAEGHGNGADIVRLNLDNRNLQDRWMRDAVTAAAARHAGEFLATVAASDPIPTGHFAKIVDIVAAHFAADRSSDVNKLLIAFKADRPKQAEMIIVGMARAWPKSRTNKATSEGEKSLVELLPKLSAGGKGSLMRLTRAMGSDAFAKYAGEIVKTTLATAQDEKASDADRIAAAKQTIELQPESGELVTQLLDLITIRTSPALAAGVVAAVCESQAKEVGERLIPRVSGWTPAIKAEAIRGLLSRPSLTASLLDAIEKGSVKLSELALDQRQALAAHPDKPTASRAQKLLAKSGDLPNADRQKVVEKLLALTKKTGDVAKGKEVFKAQCAKCHAHSGEGSNIGPDLSGMATHPKEEMLIHIMDPSRSVEGNFRVWTVTTEDGKVYTGMLTNETKTTIELIDTEAKKTLIQRDKIEQLAASEKSLMPEGFEKQLKETEIADLLEFLAKPGKYLPLPLDKVATIVSTRGMFYDEENRAERLVLNEWKQRTIFGVPFQLIDPKGESVKNVILLHGPLGKFPPTMPKSVALPCNVPAKTIHLLSGVAGWAHPASDRKSVSMIVRLTYKDGSSEEHELRNGEHFADYIRKVDVPGSRFALLMGSAQMRYLTITPKREEVITKVEFVKGKDSTAPIVLAVTVEPR